MLPPDLLPDLLNGALVPGLIGYGATGMLGARERPRPEPTIFTAFGPWVAVLVAFVVLSGGLPFVASTPHRAIGDLAFLVTLTLPFQRFLAGGRTRTMALAFVGIAGAAIWSLTPLSAGGLVVAAIAIPLAIASVARLAQGAESARLSIPLMIVMALGVGGVGVIDRAGPASGFAFALAFAHFGWLLQLGGARARLAAPPVELVPFAVCLSVVAIDVANSSLVPSWTLPILALGPFMPQLLLRFSWIASVSRRASRRSLAAMGGAAFVALIAVLLAVLTRLFVV